jgi:hypothetical protein
LSLFFKNGKPKDATLLNGFCLSLGFAIVYFIVIYYGIILLTHLLPARFRPEELKTTADYFKAWLPPVFLGLFASVLCNIPQFLIKKRKLMFIAFGFLGFYALAAGIMLLKHGIPLSPVVSYLFLPAVLGNILCYIIAHRFRKTVS